jgi:hypothetical protein
LLDQLTVCILLAAAAADITCSWPVNGKFSAQQALLYNAVLDAHRSVIAAMAPGVSWPDMHTLAYKKILGALAAGGLLQVRTYHMWWLQLVFSCFECCIIMFVPVQSAYRKILGGLAAGGLLQVCFVCRLWLLVDACLSSRFGACAQRLLEDPGLAGGLLQLCVVGSLWLMCDHACFVALGL